MTQGGAEPPPNFEDAMTVGMHALADGITRSFDLILWRNVGEVVRGLAAWLGLRPAEDKGADGRMV